LASLLDWLSSHSWIWFRDASPLELSEEWIGQDDSTIYKTRTKITDDDIDRDFGWISPSFVHPGASKRVARTHCSLKLDLLRRRPPHARFEL
jgi:hypothetical protein